MAYTPTQNTSDVSFSPTFANYYGTYYSNLVRPDRAKEIFLQHPTEKVGLTDFLRRLGYTMGNKNGYSMRTNVTFGHFEEERMQLAVRPDAPVAAPGAGLAGTFAIATALEDPSLGYFPVRVNDVLEHARSGVQSIVTLPLLLKTYWKMRSEVVLVCWLPTTSSTWATNSVKVPDLTRA
jgi:hypothetical protein